MLSAREAISSHYQSKSLNVDPESIILTAGTSEAYSMIFRVLCEPGDEALVPVPSYPLFEFLAQLNDVVIKPYHLRYDGEWHIDMATVVQSLTDRTKAIIVVNPHNPTGMFLKKSELALLSAISEQHKLSLIVDEVFADYAFSDGNTRVVSTANSSNILTFTLNGISKLAGLPQMKLGWIVVSGPAERKNEALARLEIIADTYLSVNTPVQVALPMLLECGTTIRDSIRRRTAENLKAIRQLVSGDSKCTLLQSEGGWYAILQVPRTRTDEEWAIGLLQDEGVYTHPGYFFDFENDNMLVLSLLPDVHVFEDGARRITDYVARTCQV
jgi:aspartate/methionine/tyrosine aminotransferase